jgi:hypothetical protein
MTGPDEPSDRGGRRAFFSAATDGDPELSTANGHIQERVGARGRRAFFSAADGTKPPEPVWHGVIVECRTCLVRAPVSVSALVMSLIPSVWLPTRPWPRLMRCPHCGRRSWCRVRWLGR